MPDKITVYIRNGVHDHERQICFRRPDRIPKSELEKAGVAVDGTQCLLSVYPRQLLNLTTGQRIRYYLYQFGLEGKFSLAKSLPGALAQVEAKLVAFLNDRGYGVEFV